MLIIIIIIIIIIIYLVLKCLPVSATCKKEELGNDY